MNDRIQSRAIANMNKVYAKDLSFERRKEIFDQRAETYDEDVGSLDYKAPELIAEVLEKLFPEGRCNIRILDVAAGTGLVGVKLHDKGFTHVDALEPSQGMMEKARQRNVYKDLFSVPITEKPLDIPANSYDVVTAAGGFGGILAPIGSLREMTRLVRSGGFIVIISRQYFGNKEEYSRDFLPFMQQLETEKILKKIEMSPCFLLKNINVTGEKMIFGVL